MRSTIIAALIALTLALLAVSAAVAANPPGAGQPGQDCEALGTQPNGFGTAGFAHAKTVYAGSGASVNHAASGNAVSQYDVACFQQLSNH